MSKYDSYRALPFWSWNDRLDVENLIGQIHWMHDNGIGGYFMHARSGLQTEYLSEEWMKCIESCADEGLKLGMKSWVYDENGWPSGFVGGKLLEDISNHDKYILYKTGEFDKEATIIYLIGETDLIRVTNNGKDGEYLNLYIRNSVSSVDVLNPKVVKQFLELTHERYKERFGEAFSDKIEGFFTDEPQYYRWNTPYTVMLEEYWREHFGEEIFDKLGLLFVEKEGYKTFRFRYWKAMQELMLDGFAKLVYEWCEENHVKLTGHYIEEASMGLQMMCCAGVMPFYEYEHIPGIDWLCKGTDYELPAKQVGSVAAQLGKKQVITETFACCGWDVTPSELKRIAGFQYVNGVNMMCQHLIPYSERGTRKYDHPAHYSEINPWVREEFKTFNDYFTRLGYYLGEGLQHVNVAMIHPIRSTYFDYKRELLDEGFGVAELDEKLQKACRMLSSRGINYHFLDETILAKYGSVGDGKIKCGCCEYEYLLLPTMLTMDKTTELLLHKYVTSGGKVLLLDKKPIYLEAEEYRYSYLESNTTMEDIIDAQPYKVKDYRTDIYSTYRTIGNEKYLYIINASDRKSYTQTYDCGSSIRSFDRIDLANMSHRSIPLTIHLEPGEDAFLRLSEETALEEKEKVTYNIKFDNSEIEVKNNILPIDNIRYSFDGQHYSEPWPRPALFQKLIREQYKGIIYFRYDFDIEKIPNKILLKAEKCREQKVWLNNMQLTQPIDIKEGYVNVFDISGCVKKGINHYIECVDWYEDEQVHYALYGENVTESLKNCIVYDTELQPIELIGDFGVYPRSGYTDDIDRRYVKGNHFYIDEMPQKVTEPSTDGFPFLSGEMILRKQVLFETTDICLRICGDYQLADVKINGKTAGRLLFEKVIDISDFAVKGLNDVEVRFILSNRNLMGPHHLNADKNWGINPFCFELQGTWNGRDSDLYHEEYDIKKILNA